MNLALSSVCQQTGDQIKSLKSPDRTLKTLLSLQIKHTWYLFSCSKSDKIAMMYRWRINFNSLRWVKFLSYNSHLTLAKHLQHKLCIYFGSAENRLVGLMTVVLGTLVRPSAQFYECQVRTVDLQIGAAPMQLPFHSASAAVPIWCPGNFLCVLWAVTVSIVCGTREDR